MTLSTAVGRETLQSLPAIVKTVDDESLLKSILSIATEISRRSAKHSAEFLKSSADVALALKGFDDKNVSVRALELAGEFAARAGGIASDAWAALPTHLLNWVQQMRCDLLSVQVSFLEARRRRGSHVLLAGGELLRLAPEVFDDWIELLWVVAKHGNASLVAFVRSSSRFFRVLNTEVIGMKRSACRAECWRLPERLPKSMAKLHLPVSARVDARYKMFPSNNSKHGPNVACRRSVLMHAPAKLFLTGNAWQS
jgi:hypothetical protein